MKVNLQSPVEEVQIQIIPLIDVVFCILTFFLLAGLQFTRQQAINVDLPKASTGTSSNISSQQGKSNILPVTIDAVGKTFVEKDQVTRDQLAQRLKEYVQQNPTGVLVLNASRTATYNDVIETLDLLRQVGGDRVSLGIIPGSSEPSPTSNQPVAPAFPTNPGAAPIPNIPNTIPVPGANPQGNFNPYQAPFPTAPGAGVSPVNPGVAPVVPNVPLPQAPVAPGNTNPNTAPQR
ncbi:MAG: biopolymer transporter ExbD [Gloeotrichia echinulata IR180]|jgi:biopolymer transport protein ExbD|nr:biopolymer transporter ExbD [Gloeotrichia echinulata DEX184]